MHVLYVDDDPELRQLIPYICSLKTSTTFLTSPSGNHAIELLKAGARFDLIISDYVMPNGNGGDLWAYVWKNNLDIPFLFFTSTTTSLLIEKRANFLGVIHKHDWDGLLRSIQDLQRRLLKAGAIGY